MGETGNMSGRKVVVTADDAGLRSQWDRAILGAHRSGGITAVSVVTNGPSYPEMRADLLETPDLDVGVHLNLIEGRPLGTPERASSLTGGTGSFPGSVLRFLSLYLTGRTDRDQISMEWEHQIRRAVDDGLRPVHLNSHYHVHLLPGLFEMSVSLARRFEIPFVRVADEPPWALFGPAFRPIPLAKVTSMWLLAGANRRVLRRAGMDRNISTRGTGLSGWPQPAEWAGLARRLGDGNTEIICHPGQSRAGTWAVPSSGVGDAFVGKAAIARFRDLQEGHERG
jgi:predicted glycoside hydrolase/deacetylase ChbG (UPF0249 family)